MTAAKPIFTKEIFRFFRELGRHNKKVWMDANRERYQETVVLPFRRLCEELSPAVLKLDSRFDAMGRRGANFSRINRDIRFAKDKTPYRTHMYLKFGVPLPGEMKSGQLYTGISSDTVTVGFRIYAEPKRKLSSIALIAEPRIAQNPKWLAPEQKVRKLLVCDRKRRMDKTRRLANDRRLAKTARLDRSQETFTRRRNSRFVLHGSRKNLPRFIAPFEVHRSLKKLCPFFVFLLQCSA